MLKEKNSTLTNMELSPISYTPTKASLEKTARIKRAALYNQRDAPEESPPSDPPTIEKTREGIIKRLKGGLAEGIMSEETLIGCVTRYLILKAGIISTYTVMKNMGRETEKDLDKIEDLLSPLNMPTILPDMYPKIEKTVNKTFPDVDIVIENEVDVLGSLEKTIFLKTYLALKTEGQVSESILELGEVELNMQAIDEAIKAMEGIKDSAIRYGPSSTLMTMGIMLLYSPSALTREQIDEQIMIIDNKIKQLLPIQKKLAAVGEFRDEEIENLMENYKKMKLDGYIDNILSGNIFGMDWTNSHKAALIDASLLGTQMLKACGIKADWLRHNSNIGELGQKAADFITEWTGIVTGWANAAIRSTSSTAIKIGTALLGVSDGVISAVLGAKMIVQKAQMDIEEFAKSKLSLINIPIPDGYGDCPIEPLMMTHLVTAMAEATIKNAVLVPIVSIADVIMKPIFEALTDLTSEIQSYEDMLGNALSSAFNLISIDRWVMYVLCSQVKELQDNVSKQLKHYGDLRSTLERLRMYIPKKDPRYALLEKNMRRNLAALKLAAEKNDQFMENKQKNYTELYRARSIVGSMYGLLAGKAATRTDKENFFKNVASIDEMKAASKEHEDKIKGSYENLGALWDETTTQIRNGKMVETIMNQQINMFKMYLPIPRIILGIDLTEDLDNMEKRLAAYFRPNPKPKGATPPPHDHVPPRPKPTVII